MWRQIPGWPDYEVSATGEIRRWTGRILRQSVSRAGYHTVGFKRGTVRLYVHRLVAAAFLGPCPTGHEVNHRDGVKAHNGAENLEYLTPRENTRHAIHVLGHRQDGEHNVTAKLTAARVHEIRTRHGALGEPFAKLGRLYGVTGTQIKNIVTRRQWTQSL